MISAHLRRKTWVLQGKARLCADFHTERCCQNPVSIQLPHQEIVLLPLACPEKHFGPYLSVAVSCSTIHWIERIGEIHRERESKRNKSAPIYQPVARLHFSAVNALNRTLEVASIDLLLSHARSCKVHRKRKKKQKQPPDSNIGFGAPVLTWTKTRWTFRSRPHYNGNLDSEAVVSQICEIPVQHAIPGLQHVQIPSFEKWLRKLTTSKRSLLLSQKCDISIQSNLSSYKPIVHIDPDKKSWKQSYCHKNATVQAAHGCPTDFGVWSDIAHPNFCSFGPTSPWRLPRF